MRPTLGNDWDQLLKEEFAKDYYQNLRQFLRQEYASKTIYPDKYRIFEALKLTSFEETKVVILGQDPYHGPGQAHGLAFSVQPGVPSPPSLRNIFREIANDVGATIPNNGCLIPWAKQGVLLLNNTLTVRAGQAGSHRGKGWEQFTASVLRHLNEKKTPIVCMFWGRDAQRKGALIDTSKHLVLEAAHPSPLAAYRGFFGSAHFSKANNFLVQTGQKPIDWQIPQL